MSVEESWWGSGSFFRVGGRAEIVFIKVSIVFGVRMNDVGRVMEVRWMGIFLCFSDFRGFGRVGFLGRD